MRSKDLLVGHSRSICLRKGLDDSPRVTGVGNRRDASRVADLKAAPGCCQIFVRRAGGLQLSKLADPGRKLTLAYLPGEAGEFQMGVRID
jgi:hypothetical protein